MGDLKTFTLFLNETVDGGDVPRLTNGFGINGGAFSVSIGNPSIATISSIAAASGAGPLNFTPGQTTGNWNGNCKL